MFKDYAWLKIPRIHWELSTTRVLVMDYLVGGQVDDIQYIDKNKIDRIDIASKIGQLYSNMIFTHGFVHSDPHPGNILVKKGANGGTEVILLDHGLYAVRLRLSIILSKNSICIYLVYVSDINGKLPI